MNAHASPLLSIDGQPDSSLATVLAALAGHEDKSLVLTYAGRQVQPGYHVTEIKAGSFVTLDCGNTADAWQETILQVEDIPAHDNESHMSVGKFLGILAQVDRKVRLNADARLTIEVSRPGEAMQMFDVAAVAVASGAAVMQLDARPAICKPRHRATRGQASACCSPTAASTVRRSCCG